MQRIAHNRRNPKKNPYLIQSNTARSAVPLNYIARFARAFNISEAALIWGSEAERERYQGALFCQIIQDSLHDDEMKDCVKTALYEYIPYAIWDYFETHGETYKILGGYPMEMARKNSFMEAIARLYLRLLNIDLSYAFYYDTNTDIVEVNINTFFYFIMWQPDTYKLNKRIKDAVHIHLQPLLKDLLSDDMMPYDPKTNYFSDVARYVDIEFQRELGVEQWDHLGDRYWDTESRAGNFVEADLEKIRSLFVNQLKAEGVPDVTILENKWCPTVCLL